MRAAAIALLAFTTVLAAQPARIPDLDTVAGLIVRGTNDLRREKGLPPLEPDATLEATARDFASFLARNDKLDHSADGAAPPQRARRHGYRYCFVAENIGFHLRTRGFSEQDLARTFVEGWNDSPGHRRNLLHRDATQTGVALDRSEKSGRYYAVQMFGQPESMAVRFSVANESTAPAQYRVGEHSFSLSPLMVRTHQVCGAEEVGFRGRMVRAANGDRFVILREDGAPALRRR